MRVKSVMGSFSLAVETENAQIIVNAVTQYLYCGGPVLVHPGQL